MVELGARGFDQHSIHRVHLCEAYTWYILGMCLVTEAPGHREERRLLCWSGQQQSHVVSRGVPWEHKHQFPTGLAWIVGKRRRGVMRPTMLMGMDPLEPVWSLTWDNNGDRLARQNRQEQPEPEMPSSSIPEQWNSTQRSTIPLLGHACRLLQCEAVASHGDSLDVLLPRIDIFPFVFRIFAGMGNVAAETWTF